MLQEVSIRLLEQCSKLWHHLVTILEASFRDGFMFIVQATLKVNGKNEIMMSALTIVLTKAKLIPPNCRF
jgi:hypothetical protein